MCQLDVCPAHACRKPTAEDQGLRWWVYWRLFYMACSELFRYNGGEEWFVSHYLLRKK